MLFDDGFVKVLKAHRISKSSPLFDPIKSSKQDRREKKRKINVAQLFKKKPRTTHSEDKPKKSIGNSSPSVSNTSQNTSILETSSASQDESEPVNDSMPQETKCQNWKIQ